MVIIEITTGQPTKSDTEECLTLNGYFYHSPLSKAEGASQKNEVKHFKSQMLWVIAPKCFLDTVV